MGSPTGLDEVSVKLQAFMELWKGLAHDVDDLYDKVGSLKKRTEIMSFISVHIIEY